MAARRSELAAVIAQLDNEPVCCDIFVYYVTVDHADGSSLQATVDDDPEATLLWELIRVVPDPASLDSDRPSD